MAVLSMVAFVVPAAATPASASATAGVRPCATVRAEAVAADESAGRAEARACGTRVELLPARTSSTAVFANPDGTSTAEISAQPQRVKRADGRWVPIDTNLRLNRDGSVSPVAVPADLRFSGGGTAPLVTLARGSAEFTLSWPAALPAPTLDGDTATYAGIMSGVDLQLRATATGFTHVLVVRSRQAAQNPALAQIAYGIGGSGVSVQATADGVSATAADGTPLVWSGAAQIWDSSPARAGSGGEPSTGGHPGDGARRAPADVHVAAGRLLVTPDQGLLTGEQTTYPLYIDPPFSYVASASRWAYADDANATNDTIVARVGLNPDSGDLYRSFFEFPMSSGGYNLAGARIISAKVNATLVHSWSCSPTPVYLWRTGAIISTPRTAWSPGLSQYLDGRSANAHKGSNDCGDQPNVTMTFTGGLAADMQARLDSGVTSYTVGLSARDANGNGETYVERWKKFDPSSVSLTVTFDHAPTTPTAAQMSIDPSFDCGGATLHVNTLSGITLRAQISDVDNDTITPEFQVTGVPASYLHPSGPAVSGDFTATVDAAAFTDGASYSWTVRGSDGLDTGGWGPACTFIVDNSVPGTPIASSTDLALGTGLLAPPAAATAVVGRPAAVSLQPAPGGGTIGGYFIAVSTNGPGTPAIWVPASADGSATAPVVPLDASTTNYLSVQAKNLTGQVGGVVTYRFKANPGPSPAPRVRNDATGDGKADPLLVSDVDGGNDGFWRWATNSSGTGVLPPTAPMGMGGFPGGAKTVRGDFDGDGRSDVAIFSQPASSPLSVVVGRSDGDALRGVPVDTSNWTATTLSSMKPIAGDFTGDGRDDLGFGYLVSSSQWNIYVAASTGTTGSVSFAPLALFTVNSSSNFAAVRLVAADVTGDGRSDVVEAKDLGTCGTGLYLHTSTGTAISTGSLMWSSGANGLCWSAVKMFAGDFDGEGHADLAMLVDRGTCQTDLRIWYAKSDGSGLKAPVTAWSASGTNLWCWNLMATFAGDMSGDGKADIAIMYTWGNRQVKLWTFTSTGTAFSAPARWWEGGIGPAGTGSVLIQAGARYQLVPTFDSLCMGIAGSSTSDGTPFTEQTCSASALNTQLTFEPVGAAYLKVHPAHASGKCLDINGPSADDMTALHQWSCYTALNQVWQLGYVGGTDDVIVSVLSNWSGKCADVANGGTAVGTPWVEYTCHGGDPQQYHLRKVS